MKYEILGRCFFVSCMTMIPSKTANAHIRGIIRDSRLVLLTFSTTSHTQLGNLHERTGLYYNEMIIQRSDRAISSPKAYYKLFSSSTPGPDLSDSFTLHRHFWIHTYNTITTEWMHFTLNMLKGQFCSSTIPTRLPSSSHPLQAVNCCRNSRLVVDEDDLKWVEN